MDMKTLMNASLDKLIESGKIETMMDERLEKTLKEILDSLLSSYSDFGKAIKEALAEKLKVDFSSVSLAEYNTLMLNKFRELATTNVLIAGNARLEAEMQKLLAPLEKNRWTVTEIVEEFKKHRFDGDSEDDRITVILERDGSFGHIYLDESRKKRSGGLSLSVSSDRDKYSCQFRLGFRVEKETPDEGKLYTIKDGDTELKDLRNKASIYGFSNFMFKLYAQGCTIVDDHPDEDDLAYVGEHD